MQITASQTLATATNATAPITVTPTVVPDSKTQTITAAESSPSTIVEISNTVAKEPASTYEKPVEIVQVRNTQDKTATALKISQQLSTNLSSISAKKTGFSVQTFFSQVGALSRETSDYKNEARVVRVAGSKANEKVAADFSTGAGKPQETVTLQIRTKDGDTIDIKVQRSTADTGDSLAFSFKVTGKLSEEEQTALEKLAGKLGEVADDFFRTGTSHLHGLKEFDKANLQDFHLEFSRPKADTYETMSYDFSVDEASQTQHLHAKDVDDYSVDITTNLQGLLGGATAASSNSMNAYLKIIRDTLNQYQPTMQEHSNTLSAQFIIDSFTSMVTPAESQFALPNPTLTEKAIDAFDSGLPDFNATINAPLLRKRANYLFPESMSLQLSQKTEIEKRDDGGVLVKQTNSFERHSTEIEGIVGSDKGDLKTGNFIYKTVNEKQQTSRILDLNKKNINNLITEHTSSTNNTEKTYNDFHLQDTKKDQHSERQLTQLIDDVKKYKGLRQQAFDSLNYISLSNDKLFF
ncbi:MAG: hypothetical protein EOO53_03270 [Gammaproteobacteria bacterium]|nr:MAG: hypothetical protein EOO53_03270 [Gammaproteobacteria bacterium]